ncbi:TPA: transposase [Bacillus thuringiensis]|nr:transposase [Bacillus thuringiensis]HDR8186272.1 transposase [Bacillus thuringiensis]
MNIYLLEPGRDATTKSYLWVYRTGRLSYNYQPTKSRRTSESFFTDFEKYLQP